MRAAPTYRLVLLALAAGAPALHTNLVWLNGVLNICLLVSAMVDLAMSRRRIEIVRKPRPVLSIGAENPISLEVRSPGQPLEIELKDDLPLTFEQVGAWPRFGVGSPEWQSAKYRVRPMRRGNFTLGPLHGRYTSRLGLWHRFVTWSLPYQAGYIRREKAPERCQALGLLGVDRSMGPGDQLVQVLAGRAARKVGPGVGQVGGSLPVKASEPVDRLGREAPGAQLLQPVQDGRQLPPVRLTAGHELILVH